MTLTLEMTPDHIIVSSFIAAVVVVYLIGAIILRKYPIHSEEEQTQANEPLTGFVWLFSALWVPIAAVVFTGIVIVFTIGWLIVPRTKK